MMSNAMEQKSFTTQTAVKKWGITIIKRNN